MTPLLGCIADDFTGGTDLASMLVKTGLRTVQTIGIPQEAIGENVDAVVVALKSRTCAVDQAVGESLAALRWLQQTGCRQYYFKYCSTFDSTPSGNIGPVAEALMQALDCDFTVACPAFPANGRTVYKGHLFVGDGLLSESGMRHHPLTPMTDANLVRVLQAQVSGRVGLVESSVVRRGVAAVAERFAELKREGCRFAVLDALSDADLEVLGAACADLPLLTAGSGLALGLAQNFRQFAGFSGNASSALLPASGGFRAVIAGSCSLATQGQVAAMQALHPAFTVDSREVLRGFDVAGQALAWAASRLEQGPLLFHSTAAADAVQAVQREFGSDAAGSLIEETLANIACGLVGLGVGQMIVAGGETSGAVVKALAIRHLRIGPEIAPGVPWTAGTSPLCAGRPLALALKSGNFGAPDFFLNAWERLAT